MTEALNDAVCLLQNSKSLKRESGAKRLRKLGCPEAGEALLQALQKEVKDKRTWSVQYHLIIALGVTKTYVALPFLWDLVRREFEATFLYQGLGDAILRLSYEEQGVEQALESIFATQDVRVFNGAFRALAMLKLVPSQEAIQRIIRLARDPAAVDFIRGYPNDKTGLRYWIAVASAGWKEELVASFLKECEQVGDTTLRWAAENSKKGKYVKYDY
jgi:HEAT repeat protein